MSVMPLGRMKSQSKTFRRFDNLNSVEKIVGNIHRRLVSEYNPLPRMKTVRLLTKDTNFTRGINHKSTLQIQRPFKISQKTEPLFKKRLSFGVLQEISPINVNSFQYNNRLDESKADSEDTLSVIFESLNLHK